MAEISQPFRGSRKAGWDRSLSSVGTAGYLPVVVRVSSLICFFGAWEAIGQSIESRILFAPISEVATALFQMMSQSEFWVATLGTLKAFVLGLGLAIAIGIVVGVCIGYWKVAGALAEPYLRWFLAMPISGLVPLIILGFGIGVGARGFVVFLMAVLEIIANAYVGVRNVDKQLIEMGQSFTGTNAQIARTLVLPGALPMVYAGVRLGTGKALIGMVIAELLLASDGIGLLLKRYSSRLQAAEVLAVVLFLLIFAALVMQLIQALERRALKSYGLTYAK
jgi:ABC-type nitrate/sulfonate/bicarbonate transport system permease component